jgi:glyceraldehyde-3-phosphate dehydrogenase (NADP+)
MRSRQDISSIFPERKSIPHGLLIDIPVHQDKYLINGRVEEWAGPAKEVYSPVCLKGPSKAEPMLVGSYPLLTEKEATKALNAAVAAYDNGRGLWPTMSVGERIKHIEELTYRIVERKDEIVKLLMWEVGKSLEDVQREFERTVRYIKDTVGAVKDLDRISSRFVIEEGIIGQIRRAPLGVCLCMGPFNYPLNETFTTLIPALIMGNSAIVKPPKHGVLLYGCLLEAFRDAFPRGVVNTIYGRGREVLPSLIASGRIDVLAFIGSSRGANQLKKQHPRLHRLRSVLGLEAKNAAIVLPDADLDLTVKECVLGSLSFNGQRCTALKILFVHSRILDFFLEKFVETVSGLKCGMPWEENVFITPLPEPDKPKFLTELVEDAVHLGAKVANEQGGAVNETFFYPAVLFPVKERMRVYHQEQFGPVIPVVSFDDMDTPIEYVIRSNYGQQLSIFGTNPHAIADLIDPLVNQVCRVNINSQCQRGPDTFPFTGRKDSAEGTLSVSDALRVFSIRTLVAAKEVELNKEIMTTIVREHASKFLSTDFIL